MRLSNKVCLVTGASRGIGRATALALAQEGAAVAAVARTKDDSRRAHADDSRPAVAARQPSCAM